VSVAALDRAAGSRGPLERCSGDPEAFLRDVWGRRAMVRARDDASGFDDLLSLDAVDRFITTTSLRTPYFRLVRAGTKIAESDYTRSGRTGSRNVEGMADPAKVAALLEGGATIVLQGLHRWSEPVTRFARELELELGHPCQVNAYVTPPGARGLDLHKDGHDVFVLQAFGRKRWEVHTAPRESSREPWEAEVGPGDIIYMPAGTPHAAAAQDVVSGHLTVGVHVTPWRDVLADVWTRLMASMDEPVPAGWAFDPGTHARELGELLHGLAQQLERVDVHEVTRTRVERWLSNRAQLARGQIAERARTLEVDDDTTLHRRAGSVCELSVRPDRLVVLLGDRRLEMPGWLEPAMLRIAGSETFRLGSLAEVVPDGASRAVLARRLVREGLLTARDDGV
jgi:mannose-6-phosphate isomerase-like protein (cupin superfamily)